MDLFANLRLNVANYMAGIAQAKSAAMGLGMQGAATGAQVAQAFGVGPGGAGGAVAQTTSNIMQLRNTLAGASMAVGLLATGFVALGKSMVQSFADQEQAFSGILKTVEATDEQFEQLRNNLTTLSNRIPVKFEDLARIGELAGQLGVRGVGNLTKFIETIARVTESTNLTTEAAAIGFARIASIMQEPIANVDRMASVVVALGNNFEATEREIVTFATRIAATGKIAGLTTGEVFALATAFTSVGVQAEAGGTSVNKMLIEMATAVSTSSDKLLIFAKIAQDTPEGFKKLFRTEPAEAFKKVIEGLGREGEGAFAALEAITGIQARVLRAFLSLAQAGGKLSETLVLQNQAWRDNLANMIESEKKFGTLTGHFRILQNNIENFSGALGKTLAPVLRLFSTIGTAIVEAFKGLPGWVKTLVALTVAATALTLTLTAFLTTIGFIAIAAAAVGIPLSTLAIGFGAVVAGLVALGAAVTIAVKKFGLFSETSNQLEARLRGQKGAIEENQSSWREWWQAFEDTMSGAGIVTSRLFDVITTFFSDVLSGMFAWAEEYIPAWDKVWETLKTTANSALDIIGDKSEFVMRGLLSIIGIGPLIELLGLFREVGAANRVEVEKNAASTKDLTAATDALNREFPKQRAQLGSSILSLEEYGREIRKIELATQRQTDAAKIAGAVLKVQRENERVLLATEADVFREREQAARDELTEKLKVIGATRSGLERELGLTRDGTKALAEKIALTGLGAGKLDEEGKRELNQNQELFKDRSKRIDEITKKIQDANTDRILAEQNFNLASATIGRDRREFELKDFIKNIEIQDKLAISSAQAIVDTREDQNNQLAKLYESDTQTFIRETIQKGVRAAAALEESLAQAGVPEHTIMELLGKQIDIADATIFARLTEGARKSAAAVSGLREALGLEEWTLEYQKLTLAQSVYFKSLEDLSDVERARIDILAGTNAQLEQDRLTTEQLVISNNALMVGLGRLVGMEDARAVQDIKRREARLQSVLGTLNTINDAEQKSAQLRASIDQADAQNKKRILDFSLATIRRYVAEQETVWRGLARAIEDVFSDIQRTLSDVFFEFFTTGTFKLADAWKSMLNSMLRTLTDFLAQQAMQTFLGFLFGAPAGSGGLAGAAGGVAASLVGGAGSSGLLGGVLSSFGQALGLVSSGSAAGQAGGGSSGFSFPGFSFPGFSPTLDTSGFDFGGGFGGGFDFGGDYGGDFGDWGDWEGYWAEGGRVPGSGRGDVVPAMLEPGEFVVRRSVAEAMGPILDSLNAFGRPTARGGRLSMATGGQVNLTGLGGTSFEDLRGLGALQAIGYLLQQQIALQKQVAENTGSTADALGKSAAPTMTAGFTSITGSGGAARPVTVGAGGSPSSGSGDANSILSMLSGATGLARGASNLFSRATGTGGTAGMGMLNTSLSLLSGGLGLASGIASGNVLQGVGGGLSLLGVGSRIPAVQSLLNSTFGSSIIGSGSTAIGAGGIVSSALGIAGGSLGLYANISRILETGASTGNIVGALMNAYQIYSASAPVIRALTGTTLPTFSSIASQALVGIFPSLAAGAGLASAEAGIGLGAGSAFGGAGAGIGSALSSVGGAAIPLIMSFAQGGPQSEKEAAFLAVDVAAAAAAPFTFGASLAAAGIARGIEGIISGADIGKIILDFGGLGMFYNLFDKPGPYIPKRKAAAEAANTALNTLGGSFRSGADIFIKSFGESPTSPDYAAAVAALAINAGDNPKTTISNRNPVRTELAPDVTLKGLLGVSDTSIPWTSLTGDQFRIVLDYMKTLGPDAFSGDYSTGLIRGSGDVAYLNYNSAVSLANATKGQAVQYLKYLLQVRDLDWQEQGMRVFSTDAPAPRFKVSPGFQSGMTPGLKVSPGFQSGFPPRGTVDGGFPIEARAPTWEETFRAAGGDPGSFQTGGWVRGRGYGNTVLAMLEPGEFVVPERSARRYAPLLNTMIARSGPTFPVLYDYGGALMPHPGLKVSPGFESGFPPGGLATPGLKVSPGFESGFPPRGLEALISPTVVMGMGGNSPIKGSAAEGGFPIQAAGISGLATPGLKVSPGFESGFPPGGTVAETGPQQVNYNVSIVINGNVDDPAELARILAPRLRDELRRIETRYSRAGSKGQV